MILNVIFLLSCATFLSTDSTILYSIVLSYQFAVLGLIYIVIFFVEIIILGRFV